MVVNSCQVIYTVCKKKKKKKKKIEKEKEEKKLYTEQA